MENEGKSTLSGANDTAGPFSIGQDAVWPGLSKLVEECGEVMQIVGKLIATSGDTNHWSGRDLGHDLEDELADVMAACHFVQERCLGLNRERIVRRVGDKLSLFSEWHGDSDRAHELLVNAYLYGRPTDPRVYP